MPYRFGGKTVVMVGTVARVAVEEQAKKEGLGTLVRLVAIAEGITVEAAATVAMAAIAE
ncbi:MAG: hypothetical protein WBY44_32750 [Bryobacteraceae bacterium]